MLEPISHQHRVTIRGFDNVLQGIYLLRVDSHCPSFIGIDCAGRKLQKFVRQRGGTPRVNHFPINMDQHVFLQLVINLALSFI